MDSRFRHTIETIHGTVKKKYCDKQFKKNLLKAIKANYGEPDNIERIQSYHYLKLYSSDKIIEFINATANDVQKGVEMSIDDPETQKTIHLANLLSNSVKDQKPKEVPMLIKIKTESEKAPCPSKTNNVNFSALHQFLYTAMSGLPDYTNLNENSLKVLHDTHELLMNQVNEQATPEFLDDLKMKICADNTEAHHKGVQGLNKIFQDKSLNPFNFPFEYLLNGSLPSQAEEEKQSETPPAMALTLPNAQE